MKFFAAIFLTCISVSAFASTPSQNLHEISYSDAPKWEMLSLKGFDAALRKAYDTKSFDWGHDGSWPVVFDGLEYSEFSKVTGKLKVHSETNRKGAMRLSFSSCNGMMFIYERDGTHWKYVTLGSSMISCERVVTDESGMNIILPTPMFLDKWFTNLAPDINEYRVSEDGQLLTLFGKDDETLGLFRRIEAAE